MPAIVPILLFIGLVIGAQAFARRAEGALRGDRAGHRAEHRGVGLRPHRQRAGGRRHVGGEVGTGALAGAGVVYAGLHALGAGSVLAGMVLGAIAVFLIDRKFLWAAGYAGFGAVLAAVGLIHGDEVEIFADLEIALGYAFLAIVAGAFHFLGVPRREVDLSDPVDVEDAMPVDPDPTPRQAPAPQPAPAPAA